MPEQNYAAQLDRIIDVIVADPRASQHQDDDAEIAALVRVASSLRGLPREAFKQRLKSELERSISMSRVPKPAAQVPSGTNTEAQAANLIAEAEVESQLPQEAHAVPSDLQLLTPYLVAADADALLRFTQQAFAAEQTMRSISPTGGLHGEVRIGDSKLMIGGGTPGHAFQGQPTTAALHIYVTDTDAAYEKALAAGATSLGAPVDHDYGERGASVKDHAGNFWYIATHKGQTFTPAGLRTVNPYMHPLRGEPVIAFLTRAFDAQEIARYASPDGVIHHAQVRLGNSVIEMGEARDQYQPMRSMFYLYVPDADASYSRALAAGASSIQAPADQPYGDRNAAVLDAFGNTWYIATRLHPAHS
jgi:PhnB protein